MAKKKRKKGDVYRQVALERLSSPEQLDQLMQVTRPTGWLALSTLIFLVAAAVTWGVVGSIPTEAVGEGILIRRGGVSQLVAPGSGQVEEILVAVGDVVEAGQAVARIRQEGLIRQIEDGETRNAALEAEYEDLVRFVDEQRRLSGANLEQQRANLERTAATLERNVELLEERVAVEQDLLDDGLITQQTLLATEAELNTTRDQVAATRLQLNGLELERLETEQRLAQQLETRRGVLRDLEIEIGELRASLDENARILAAESGRVLELLVDRGDVVSPGTSVLSMEVVSEELMAAVFVPAELGKQITVGLEARIVPSTVQREEHGFMLGEVTRVAEFPSTSRGMQRLLANQELVARLMAQGPPIQVDVRLERDPSTPTGFRWSSSSGPEIEISSGTLASGSIIVRRDRPLALVIPQVRKQLGI